MTQREPLHRRTDLRKSFVGFFVGGVHYAVGIGLVREIVNPLAVTPMAHAPPDVAGVADHRGDVVVVLDLRSRFRCPIERTRQSRWILVADGARSVALAVDGVTDVFAVALGDLKPAPDVGGNAEARAILGVVPHPRGLTFVLDVERLLAIAVDAEELPEPPR